MCVSTNVTMYITYIILLFFLFDYSLGNIPPKLEELKPKRFQNLGSKFTIGCSPQEGSKPFQFEWQKDNHVLTNSNNNQIRLESFEDSSVLIIDKLLPTDSGRYTCTVRNSIGSDFQFTELTVKGL